MNESATTTESFGAIQPGTTIFELSDGVYVEWRVCDLVWRDGGVSALLESDDVRATVGADRLERVVTDDTRPGWAPSLFDGHGPGGVPEWVPHPRHADRDADGEELADLRLAPATPSDLTFEKIEGRGSRRAVNRFLDGTDGLVFHALGGVASWKAAFVARFDGRIVSAIVLHHYHPSTNGEELAITRLANHESAPANTSTWMIGKSRDWAERAGYDRLATYAGVGGNDGTCYEAAGFEAVGDPVQVTGTAWTSDDDTEWRKQKFIYRLDPDTYADKSATWAVKSVVDDVTVPGRTASKETTASAEAGA